MLKTKENKLELDLIQKQYPKFYEYLDKTLLNQTEIYYFRQLYDVFDRLGYNLIVEKEQKYFDLKIYPIQGFVHYKTGFKDRPSAELDGFEYLIKLFENGKIINDYSS
jgi:hypothetical protein